MSRNGETYKGTYTEVKKLYHLIRYEDVGQYGPVFGDFDYIQYSRTGVLKKQ